MAERRSARLELGDLLDAADVLSLHLPALPGEPPLIDAEAIARMRPGALLVNVSRGALVDTEALLAALDEGRLGGAALDVVAGEPPPMDAPVRRHPRVLLNPHAAFWSDEAETDSYARQAANVVSWKRDGRPLTPVVEGDMSSVGEALIAGLAERGVDTIFGIPGVHTLELYRGLTTSGVRHVTPRHEQGAGFMADGFARVSGRPGVCLVISGPGVTNVLTPIAQARQDARPAARALGLRQPGRARPWPAV